MKTQPQPEIGSSQICFPGHSLLQCATNGAQAMVGKHRRFITLVNREIPELIGIHCIVYHQHLVTCNLSTELHHSLNTEVKCVNKGKAHPFNKTFVVKLTKNWNVFFAYRGA